MPAEPTIDYEALAQDAMRGVVRTVLTQAAKSGLPGDHHFYVSFDTDASGVVLSKRLKEKYPSEMTVVLQHRFWDLAVNDDGFEVKLTTSPLVTRSMKSALTTLKLTNLTVVHSGDRTYSLSKRIRAVAFKDIFDAKI